MLGFQNNILMIKARNLGGDIAHPIAVMVI